MIFLSNNFKRKASEFTSTWDTTKSGNTANDQIQLPIHGIWAAEVYYLGSKIRDIDSINDIITFPDGGGIKQIEIKGVYDSFWFDSGESFDYKKLISIENWGSLKISNPGAFRSCTNLTLAGVKGVPKIITTNLERIFRNCYSLTEVNNMNLWDVSNVTNMYQAFYNCSNFNQDIGGWDVSNVTNMTEMFGYCTSFKKDISSWDVSNVEDASYFMTGVFDYPFLNQIYQKWSALPLKHNVKIDFGNSKYDAAYASYRNILTGTFNWTITDGGVA